VRDGSVAPWLHVTDCTSHERVAVEVDVSQRAREAWLGKRHDPLARESKGEERAGGVATRGAYFCAASTGLPACLRAPSAPLAEVLIFSCARAAEELEFAGLSTPLTWAPLVGVAAAVLDMGVPLSRWGTEAQGSAEGPMRKCKDGRGRGDGDGGGPACDGRGRAAGRARRRVGVQSTGGVSCGSRRRRGPWRLKWRRLL
jgi:hypothetical protein